MKNSRDRYIVIEKKNVLTRFLPKYKAFVHVNINIA